MYDLNKKIIDIELNEEEKNLLTDGAKNLTKSNLIELRRFSKLQENKEKDENDIIHLYIEENLLDLTIEDIHSAVDVLEQYLERVPPTNGFNCCCTCTPCCTCAVATINDKK